MCQIQEIIYGSCQEAFLKERKQEEKAQLCKIKQNQ